MKDPVAFINDNLFTSGEELLYLTYFGSHLYGTANSDSDVDYKGLYLPSKEDLLLKRTRKSINWKSGNDNEKNSSDDVDIELWSLHYFMELIGKGDTGAIDLLFSVSNADAVVYKNEKIDSLFDNPLRLFDPKNTDSYAKYSIDQAKKLGVKGSRLGILKNVFKYLTPIYNDQEARETRLRYKTDRLIEKFYDSSYFFHKKVNGQDALVVCGKVHLYSITMSEFYNRIAKEYKKYGERAEKAENNEGIDYKAISHALRCICQMKELLINGKIEFPLKDANFICQIKNGKYGWFACEEYITNGLNKVEKLRETTRIEGEKDSNFIDETILNMYKGNQ